MNARHQGRALLRRLWPEVTGQPGLAQGRYGEAGNLELVVPATDDGIWVGWHNCDPEESYDGTALRRWSGALRFATGHRYARAALTQVGAGPNFLEVIGLTAAGGLRRHVWTPDDGFVDQGEVLEAAAACSSLVEDPRDGSLQVAVAGRDRRLRLLRGQPGPGYPSMTFEVTDVATTEVRSVELAPHHDHVDVVAVDSDGVPTVRCDSATADVRVGAARAAQLAIARDGRRLLTVLDRFGRVSVRDLDRPDLPVLEVGAADAVTAAPVLLGSLARYDLVVRRGKRLWHLQIVASEQTLGPVTEAPVEAAVWAVPGAVLHRG